MEFGIIIQSPVLPWIRESDPDAEHNSLMLDIEYVKAADRAGFKYAWVVEHHFLDEYSHLSANDAYIGYLVHTTERIHLGSGIFNPLPQVNHPAKVAERVAMLDHLSGGRFEFGTGRGAGTHEILGFLPEMRDLTHTREIWEDVIGEFVKMWMEEEYQGYQGKYWSLPPRKVLPKPWVKPHPAMWYAAGNASSWEMAARRGLGILGFSIQRLEDVGGVIDSYKDNIGNAEPVGAFVNDNIMVVGLGHALSEESARAVAGRPRNQAYFMSLLYRYHDTFPRPEGIPRWPEIVPWTEPTPADIAAAVDTMNPDNVLDMARRWEAAGVDQLVWSPINLTPEEGFESIRLLGEHVVAKLDTDPVHRTDRFRQEAVAKAG
jgi:alkanesulfonate monooxygenase SsuD/methylene tetrahydromethanopterin reductase-like flavin-dependent oxidoreductase (luciferase family)